MNEDQKTIMTPEMAEDEFHRFAEINRLAIKRWEELSIEEQDKQKSARACVIEAFERGTLTLEDDGLPVYECEDEDSIAHITDPIKFKKRTGSMLSVTDQCRESERGKMARLLMARMLGIPPLKVERLAGVDMKVCEAVFGFLLG